MHPKKLWKNFRDKRSNRSPSGSGTSSTSSNSRAGTINDPLGHAALATTSVALATVGSPIALQSQNPQPQLIPPSSSLAPSSSQNLTPSPDDNSAHRHWGQSLTAYRKRLWINGYSIRRGEDGPRGRQGIFRRFCSSQECCRRSYCIAGALRCESCEDKSSFTDLPFHG